MSQVKVNVAIAHHWLVGERGGEKVLSYFCRMFPDAEVYTLIKDRNYNPWWLEGHVVRESLLGYLPFAGRYFRLLLPLFPLFLKLLRKGSECNVLLISDASLIKGMNVGVPILCYCHSPPRYLWEMLDEYSRSAGFGAFRNKCFRLVARYLRSFDYSSAQRVDQFIANSKFVAERIEKYYGRKATVIYPPVDLNCFTYQTEKKEYFLVVSELVSYKRIDLAVSAFRELEDILLIIGDGPERANLEKSASQNTKFLGRVDSLTLRKYYSEAKALIFPGIEDFGLTSIEAQASGTPVIAFRGGGLLETVIENKTGLFFDVQSADSLLKAVQTYKRLSFSPSDCRLNASSFSVESFQHELHKKIDQFSNSHDDQ